LPAENQTVNPSFNIKSTATATDVHLFVFAGNQGVAFAELDRGTNMFTGVRVYHFLNDMTATERDSSLQQVLSNDFASSFPHTKKDIIWCTGQSIITPQSCFNRDTAAAMLDLVFGDAGAFAVKHELLLKQQAYNVYRVADAMEKKCTSQLPGAVQSHQSSLLVNLYSSKKELLYCNFYPGSVTVMLRKEYQLQVIQTFNYNTPEDAAYYLLHCCRCFDVVPGDTVLTACGMIDMSSNLYRELYKYFLQIDFCELPDAFVYCDEIKTYPAHYFSHLFATAACVL
jgi:Protein of unknown function (DUF3822)